MVAAYCTKTLIRDPRIEFKISGCSYNTLPETLQRRNPARMMSRRSLSRSRKPGVRDVLGRLHLAGLCHGDLRDNNNMEDEDGRIIFIDFGSGG